MKKVLCILARTGVDRHGETMLKEGLENMVSMIKNPTSAASVGVSHDPTIPPIGKVIDAWIEQGNDGEYEVAAIQEIFEDAEEIVLLNGNKLYAESSNIDNRPFNECFYKAPEKLTIEYDPINFESEEVIKQFLSKLREIIDFDEEQLVRKAEIPDPIMIINIGKAFLITLFSSILATNVADEIIEKTMPKFRAFIKTAISGIINITTPKNRPVVYILRLPANPNFDFVAKTNDANLVIEAMSLEKIEAILKEKESLLKQLKPLKVQFLLNNGNWQLNYMLTEDGKVIGTEESFKRRPVWIKDPKPGMGLSLTARRSKKSITDNNK